MVRIWKRVGLQGLFLASVLLFVANLAVAKDSKLSTIFDNLIQGKKEYRGSRVTLDLKDADLPNVLRLFADVAGVNMLVTDDVKGRITLRLVDVPWDQALDIILTTNNLGMEWVGNVIRISTLERLQKEREAKAKTQKAKEAVQPIFTELIPISYSRASDLVPKVKDLLSPRGSVAVDARTNTLIVKDTEERIAKVKELVAKLDSQTPQVLIDAKIVEASTDFRRELGISWGGKYATTYRGDSIGVSGASEGTLKESGTADYLLNLPASVGVGSGGALDFYIGALGSRFFEAKLSAMEEKGLGEIISSPRILTLDHTQAKIEQGVRIPFQKIEDEELEIDWIDATLRLTVTPHVTADGHIKLDIECAKETPDWTRTVQGNPTIKTSNAKTQVMVKDGEVVVIGGIYEYTKSNSTAGLPGLKDLPLIGWLFKSRTKTEDRRELMIFITPKIVTSMAQR